MESLSHINHKLNVLQLKFKLFFFNASYTLKNYVNLTSSTANKKGRTE